MVLSDRCDYASLYLDGSYLNSVFIYSMFASLGHITPGLVIGLGSMSEVQRSVFVIFTLNSPQRPLKINLLVINLNL